MRIMTRWTWFLLALAWTAGNSLAQNPDAPKFYKLEFVVKEVEGPKVLNSRIFSVIMPVQLPGQSSEAGSIRAGSKVPASTSGTQYYDIGVNIDCRSLKELQNDVSLMVSADLSTTWQEKSEFPPVIRQNRWSSLVLVPVKKPTVIFASDDASSRHQMQLELLATPIK